VEPNTRWISKDWSRRTIKASFWRGCQQKASTSLFPDRSEEAALGGAKERATFILFAGLLC
jgi:hypothetical protein